MGELLLDFGTHGELYFTSADELFRIRGSDVECRGRNSTMSDVSRSLSSSLFFFNSGHPDAEMGENVFGGF